MNDGIVTDLAELIAYQRYAPDVRYRPPAFAAHSGPHGSKWRGRGMDFTEARHYQAGDDIRHMEWRVTARTGRPHVKIYQEERERPLVLFVDFNPSMYFGTRVAFKSVIAARLAAILAWTAAKQGDRVGGFLLSTRGHEIRMPQASTAGVLPLLSGLSQHTQQTLASLPAAKPTYFSDALTALQRLIKPGSLVVLISDFYGLHENCSAQLTHLSRYHDVLAYHVCDPIECAPPKPGRYALSDGVKDFLLDTSIDKVRFHYQFQCEERLRTIQESLARKSIQYSQVLPSTNLALKVQQTLVRRSRG